MEKRGGSIIRDTFGEKLEDSMVDLDLLDSTPKNGKYTWNNKRTGLGHIAARLDQFLVSTSFLQKDLFPSSFIISLATLDYKPITLLLAPPTNLYPIPFRFNSLWLNNDNTLEIIHTAQNSTFLSSPNFIWESKLRVVRSALKNWATSFYYEPTLKKNNLQADLISLHSKMEHEEVTLETIAQEKALNMEILKAARHEEETLRIKYHQLWLKGGDKNSNYFHKQTKIRMICNYIK